MLDSVNVGAERSTEEAEASCNSSGKSSDEVIDEEGSQSVTQRKKNSSTKKWVFRCSFQVEIFSCFHKVDMVHR